MDMNDPENRKKALIIGLAVLVIVVYGYYNCWFGGPTPKVDLDWCPESCLAGGSSGGASGGSSGGGTTCPLSCDDCNPPTTPGCTWDRSTTYYLAAIAASPTGYTCGGTCPDGSLCMAFYDTSSQTEVCGCTSDRGTYTSFPGYDNR